MKCQAMKNQWLRWNILTERTDYLYLSFEWKETMSQAWSTWEEQFSVQLQQKATAARATDSATAATTAAVRHQEEGGECAEGGAARPGHPSFES